MSNTKNPTKNLSQNLTEDHWTVINIVRDFYLAYQIHPTMRKLISELSEQWPKEKANSIYLHKLFPNDVIKTAAHFGNIPKPPLKCI